MNRLLISVGGALVLAAGTVVTVLVRKHSTTEPNMSHANDLFDKYQARALLRALYEADATSEGVERALKGKPLPRSVERSQSLGKLVPLLERLADILPKSELRLLATGEGQTILYTLELLHDNGLLPYRIGRIVNNTELNWGERIKAFREELALQST